MTTPNKSYDELEPVVKLIQWLFTMCGIKILSVNNEEKFWNKFVRVIPTTFILMSPFGALIAMYYNIHDFIKTIETLYTFCIFFQFAVKRCLLPKVYGKIVKLFEKCRMFRQDHAETIGKASGIYPVNKIVSRPALVIKAFFISYLTCILVSCLTTMLLSERTLPLPCSLPFGPPLETPFYQINYVFTLASLLSCLSVTLVVEAVLISSTSEVCLQMNVIRYKLSTLGEDEEEDQRRKLREIFQLHWDIISLIIDLNDIFSNLLVVQFLTSFLTVSTALFMFTQKYYSFLFYFCMSISQLGVYCLYGEISKNEFDAFLFTLYENQWYNLNSYEKKSLAIMMSNAQDVPSLKAIGYVELSLETYFKILQTSYTYVTLMQSVQPEE